MTDVVWKSDPDQKDYPAAEAYLSLILGKKDVGMIVVSLASAPVHTQKAKDILRASALPLLSADDQHVAGDLEKIKKGEPLSPVLLLRGNFRAGVPLQVADGYHRVCAVFHFDQNVDIPCRIADLPEP